MFTKPGWMVGLIVGTLLGCGGARTNQTSERAAGEGATCDDACAHYMQCKGAGDQNMYGACVARCEGAGTDSQAIQQYVALDCPTAVSLLDGAGGMGGTGGVGEGGPGAGGAGGMGEGGAPAASGRTDLEDTWLYADHKMTYSITFGADGTLTINNIALKYKKEGSKYTVTAPNGSSMTYDFALAGDQLTVSGGDLPGPVTLGRANTSRGQQAQMPGVYESYESMTDSSMHMSHYQYVTLYPDGSVGWSKAEGGAARTQINENWERFRSWNQPGKQFSDAGTWSSDGASITIQWRYWGGKTVQGRVDLAANKFTLSNMGVLQEGATLEFKRSK